MSGLALGVMVLTALSIGSVLALIIGAAASVMGDRPGEDALTEAGHRAVAWGCTLALIGMAVLFALEAWGAQWLR